MVGFFGSKGGDVSDADSDVSVSGRRCGFLLFPSDFNELRENISKLAFLRVGQLALSIVTLSCSAAVHSKVKDGLDVVPDTSVVDQVLEHARSTTVFLILAAFFSGLYTVVNGLSLFYVKDPNYRITPINLSIVRTSFVTDTAMIFVTLSAFSTGLASPLEMPGFGSFIAGDGAPKAASGLVSTTMVFFFLLWLSYLYGMVLSFVIWTHQDLIAKASHSQPQPPSVSTATV